ncbi:MAG: transposase [Chloroflexi bacterium]|nr:transposase [Chloroflexota bacterium]
MCLHVPLSANIIICAKSLRSRLSICHSPEDFLKILHLLKEYGRKYQITIIAYCLLPNHYHILVRQDNTPRASLLPSGCSTVTAKATNLKLQP